MFEPRPTNDYFEMQEREAVIERMNERLDDRERFDPHDEWQSILEDEALWACELAGIGIRLRHPDPPERDDDYRDGDWWVPCFIFVPGDRNG